MLDHTGRNARRLQLAHHLLGRTLHRPGFDEGIQLLAVLNAPERRGEACVARPGGLAEDAAKTPPLLVRKRRNDAPAVLATAAIYPMRGRPGEITDHPLV